MPEGGKEERGLALESIWFTGMGVFTEWGCGGRDGERTGGSGQLGLSEGTLTLWYLDASPTESTQQVRDDVVFDLVLGEPGEHRQQPKHNGFELGRGAPAGEDSGLQRETLTFLSFGSPNLSAVSILSAHPVLQDVKEGKLCFKPKSPATYPGHHCWLSNWESMRL